MLDLIGLKIISYVRSINRTNQIMAKAEIEVLIKQKIGLAAGSIGAETLTRVLRRRMEDCGVSTIFCDLK